MVQLTAPYPGSIGLYFIGNEPIHRLNEIGQCLVFNVHIRVDGDLDIEFFLNIKNQRNYFHRIQSEIVK